MARGVAGSPAEKAGIRVGQRVLAVNGEEISGKTKAEVAFRVNLRIHHAHSPSARSHNTNPLEPTFSSIIFLRRVAMSESPTLRIRLARTCSVVHTCVRSKVRGEGGERVSFSILDTLPMPKDKVGA